MNSAIVKRISYVAFGAGVASVALSGLTFLRGRAGENVGEKSTGQFIGLWAPTFFLLAEMLDRISVQDESYMGVKIERTPIEEIVGHVRELTHL